MINNAAREGVEPLFCVRGHNMARYAIPPDFKNDDTEVRFFNKKSLIYTFAIGFPLGIGTLFLLDKTGHTYTGIIAAVLVIMPFYLFGRWKFPTDDIYNGGMDLDMVAFIYLKKKMFGQIIYVTKDPDSDN